MENRMEVQGIPVYPRPELLYDFGLGEVFINYRSEYYVPEVFCKAGGVTQRNPYSRHRGFFKVGDEHETPEELMREVIGIVRYHIDKGRADNKLEYQKALAVLDKGEYTMLVDWKKTE